MDANPVFEHIDVCSTKRWQYYFHSEQIMELDISPAMIQAAGGAAK